MHTKYTPETYLHLTHSVSNAYSYFIQLFFVGMWKKHGSLSWSDWCGVSVWVQYLEPRCLQPSRGHRCTQHDRHHETGYPSVLVVVLCTPLICFRFTSLILAILINYPLIKILKHIWGCRIFGVYVYMYMCHWGFVYSFFFISFYAPWLFTYYTWHCTCIYTL